jgi:hypothetical protein
MDRRHGLNLVGTVSLVERSLHGLVLQSLSPPKKEEEKKEK